MKTNAKKLNVYGEPMLTCPSCGSDKIAVREETLWLANTGECYCHSIKAHDSHAKAECLGCGWVGRRRGAE